MTAPTEPYRPSNGTEGEFFMRRFCAKCRRDEAFRQGEGDSCPIVAATMIFNEDDPQYPKEWVQDAGKPWMQSNERCTAFEPMGSDAIASSHVADQRQVELFA